MRALYRFIKREAFVRSFRTEPLGNTTTRFERRRVERSGSGIRWWHQALFGGLNSLPVGAVVEAIPRTAQFMGGRPCQGLPKRNILDVP